MQPRTCTILCRARPNYNNCLNIAFYNINKYYIVFRVGEELAETADQMERISHMYKGEHAIKLSVPREVLKGATTTRVRMASVLFRNMSGLLPESLKDGAQNDKSVTVPRPIPNFNLSIHVKPGNWPGDEAIIV